MGITESEEAKGVDLVGAISEWVWKDRWGQIRAWAGLESRS